MSWHAVRIVSISSAQKNYSLSVLRYMGRQDVSELWCETIHVPKVTILSLTREYQSFVRPVLAVSDSVE